MRQVFPKRIQKVGGIDPRHGGQLLSPRPNRRGEKARAHHAFEIAEITDRKFHLLRPFRLRGRDLELIEAPNRRIGETSTPRLVLAEVASWAELVLRQRTTQYFCLGAIPHL